MLPLTPHILVWIILSSTSAPVATGSARFESGPACSSAVGQMQQAFGASRVKAVCAEADVVPVPNRK
jgi:hypothetical protein